MSLFTTLLKSHALPLKSQGKSMLPILQPDDTVYFKKTSFASIKIDDLIVFQKKRQLLSHRVIYKGKKYLITKGDNTLISDGKIYPQQILGKIYQVKRGGKILHPETLYLIQSTLYFQEIVKVKNAFDKEKINYVFLKGLPLHLYFEKTQPKRIYADCDVLVDKKDFLKAQNILFSFSYQKADTSLSSFYKDTNKQMVENTYVKIINKIGVAFDLHTQLVFMMTQLSHLNLIYPRQLLESLTKEFLKNKKEVIINKEKFLILSPQFLILYLALHLFHHNFRGAFRYQFLDRVIRFSISWQKSTKKDLLWLNLSKLINRYQLNNFVYPSFLLLKKYYATPLPQSFLLSIKPKNFLTSQLINRLIKINIFNDESRIKAGINRFLNLFLFSPQPIWQKLMVFFHPQVVYSIIWVLLLKGKTLIKSILYKF